MCDFRDRLDESTTQGPYPKPHVLLTAPEVARLPIEDGWSWLLDKVLPVRSCGEGRPVLMPPGFYATGGMTGRLRSHLRAHGWRLGRNPSLANMVLDCVLAEDGERCESIAVPSSHAGLTPNPITLAVIVGRLAQDPDDITAFGWGTCLRRTVRAGLGRLAAAAAPEVGLAS